MSSAAASAAGVGKKAVHVKVSNYYVFDGGTHLAGKRHNRS
jgi:hypothetical protein